MQSNLNLESYLEDLRSTADPNRLNHALKITDNYPILLYTNQWFGKRRLFNKVVKAFRDSPQENGIKDEWNEAHDSTKDRRIFDYKPGTVKAQVFKGAHGPLTEKDSIDGSYPQICVMFHPYQGGAFQGNWYKPMAQAIAGFGDYIVKNNLTARLLNHGLDLNHTPKK